MSVPGNHTYLHENCGFSARAKVRRSLSVVEDKTVVTGTMADINVSGNSEEHRTTVIGAKAVEARNLSNRSQISDEIRSFLDGSDGNGASLGLRSEARTFFTILIFLTTIPAPSWVDLHPGFLMRGMSYFPVVGSFLGLMYSIVFDFCCHSLGLPCDISGCVMVVFGLYITACFHEDGLADSADGVGGGWSKSQVLKIMTDSRVGTFGCAALSVFLLVKVLLLSALGEDSSRAIIVSQTVARLSAPYLIRTKDYVPEVGPKSNFYRFMVEAKHLVSWSRFLFGSSYCFGVAAALYDPLSAAFLVVLVLLLATYTGRRGDYLLGGVMGDYLGGTICMCEILVLLVLVSKDSIAENLLGTIKVEFSGLYDIKSVRSLLHFVALSFALSMWRKCVGGPDIYDRELNKPSDSDKED